MLLERLAQYLKERAGDSSFHVVRQAGPAQEVTLQEAQPELRSATVVEGEGMSVHPVGWASATRFTHFLDGIERTHVPYYHDMIPVLYAFTGAVVRKRGGDRRMSTAEALSAENLYFPFAYVEPSGLAGAGIPARNVVDEDKGNSDPPDAHPVKLLELARRAVSNYRAELERDLAERWTARAGPEDWLLWDGSISGRVGTSTHPRVIGVVKSHQTQYFSGEDQWKVLGLAPGERSSVFQPRVRDWTPVYSWYLRLHPNDGRDVYFGLVRVEAAASDETVAVAEEISRWLLGERSPLSLPDGRWDRLIYPIRDCEQYLRSIAPSRVRIESALAGV